MLQNAQHEAAHVVVGLALGLRLRRVVVGFQTVDGVETHGHALFDGRCGSVEAWQIMYAAGVAWERHAGDVAWAWRDLALLHSQRPAVVRALEHASWCVLMRAQGAHARITRALCEAHALDRADLEALFAED